MEEGKKEVEKITVLIVATMFAPHVCNATRVAHAFHSDQLYRAISQHSSALSLSLLYENTKEFFIRCLNFDVSTFHISEENV
jgi:hypothetical protein